jgi:hypothetical protein
MRENLRAAIKSAYPTAIPDLDWMIGMVGGQRVIQKWNASKLGPKPNEDELIASQQ